MVQGIKDLSAEQKAGILQSTAGVALGSTIATAVSYGVQRHILKSEMKDTFTQAKNALKEAKKSNAQEAITKAKAILKGLNKEVSGKSAKFARNMFIAVLPAVAGIEFMRKVGIPAIKQFNRSLGTVKNTDMVQKQEISAPLNTTQG